jgi:hypothetical protein
MARPRTATAILAARGAFKHDPQRARHQEPPGRAKFPKAPPSRLSADERKAWREIVKIAPVGVLTGSDTLVVEIVSVLLAEFRSDPQAFPTGRLGRLTAELGRLGLNPSGRAALQIPKADADEF